MTTRFDASTASPSDRLSQHELARQAICPNCRREDRSAIWGEPLRCDECHARDDYSPAHFHAVYTHPRIGEHRTLTFDSLQQANRFMDRHTRVGTYRADMVVQCYCSIFTDNDDSMLAVIRRHDAGNAEQAS